MDTITFNCPKCDFICAFHGDVAGRKARCLRCNQQFVIPAKDGDKVEAIKAEKAVGQVLPGFYEAVFKKSFCVFFSLSSFTTLILPLILITLKFFTAHWNFVLSIPCGSGGTLDIPILIGLFIKVVVWGVIFFTYSEIICATSFDTDALPKIDFGHIQGFIPTIVKSIYLFAMTIIVIMFPSAAMNYVLKKIGIEAHWLIWIFISVGIFILPIALMTVGITRDITWLFKYHKFFNPIKKAFKPYLLVVGIFFVAVISQYYSRNYGHVINSGFYIILLHLLMNLGIQVLLVFAMRTLGLFHRHYDGFFDW